MGSFGDKVPRRIVVFRALRLGDMLCAVPALRALRAAFPRAEIALLALPWAQTLVDRFPNYIDELIEFPGFPGLIIPEPRIRELPAFLERMQRREFDLAIQLHGNGIVSNPFTVLLGARLTAGCFLPDHFCPDRETFMAYPDHEPEVWRHLRLMEHLGIPLQGEDLEFPILDSDWQKLSALAKTKELRPGEYVCLHPGSQLASRRWPVRHFAAVGDGLASRGFRVVLTGSAGETEITQGVAQAMRSTPIDLAGQITLGMLAALLKHSRILVTNDTGVSHLAAALRVPSVVVFVSSDPHRWAPLDRRRHRPVVAAGTDPAGQVAPASVMMEIEALLREPLATLEEANAA